MILCQRPILDQTDELVAISGQLTQRCDSVCTGARSSAMVLIVWSPPSDRPKMEDDETTDWATDGEDQVPEWHLPSYEEIKDRLTLNIKATEVSPVDTTSIVTKSNPIPIRDLEEDFIDTMYKGYRYAGYHNIRNELLKDDFRIKKDKRICRWAVNFINQAMRIEETCESSDKVAKRLYLTKTSSTTRRGSIWKSLE